MSFGINPSNKSGAIDVIVVRQHDGSFKSSKIQVRFGKFAVVRPKEKVVSLENPRGRVLDSGPGFVN